MQLSYTFSLLVFCILLSACAQVNPPGSAKKALRKYKGELPIDSLQLPPGFAIDVFAEKVVNARSMTLAPSGTLFVGTRGEGSVYALPDANGDYYADTIYTIASDMKMPNGVAYRDGDLYVAEVSRVLVYRDIENQLGGELNYEVLRDDYPTETHHGWKYIAFGPDGKLYIPVGAPCNICESEDPIFNTITRIDPDGNNREIVQSGVRNTVGFTWHPETKELWFTDNGRDWMGDDLPACELNRAAEDGLHFGYPYCHQGDLADPEFGDKFPCSDFQAPVQNLGPHSAPLGVEFYQGDNFPDTYRQQVLIAEHGSWNRSKKIGYQISLVTLEGNKATSYEPFIKGWLDPASDEVWGRPVDLEHLPDGSLLISDDFADAIYRVYYAG